MRETDQLEIMRHVIFCGFRGSLGSSAQSVLLVRFVPEAENPFASAVYHAESLAHDASDVYRDPSHLLRWHGVFAAFLQKAQTPMVAPEVCDRPATQCRLSSFRYIPGTVIRDHGGPATNQQDRDPAIQRRLSPLTRPSTVSRPVHASSVSQATSRKKPFASLFLCTINFAPDCSLCPKPELL
jgi:hypothetical protein